MLLLYCLPTEYKCNLLNTMYTKKKTTQNICDLLMHMLHTIIDILV